jgi:hypothetical protein
MSMPKKPNPPSKLDQLMAAKLTAVPTDGRLEVALSIASCTNLVTVDATAHPFTTVPDDLFDQKFNDPEVGLDDDQIRVFKAALKRLLSAITTDIEQIPENASQQIEQVAEFIRLSLLAASQGTH